MKILLVTLHAKYVHASLALPYLAAAGSDLEGIEFEILELTVNELRDQLLCRIFERQADVVLFSCYIWNTELTLKLASDLKQLRPATVIVLGGPEVSFGAFELMERSPAIACIVRGEGEPSCRELLEALRDGRPLDDIPGLTCRQGGDILAHPDREPIENLDAIPSPFAAGLVDLTKPLVYYESSRGCPFSCAFCMSSLEKGVRTFSRERIERDLTLLMEAGVKTVKFVDRTFNFDAARANEIWSFILKHNRSSTFHFEISAELLTPDNLALLAQVPPGLFRFEIGVQSAGEQTLESVQRKSSPPRLFEKVRRLRQETQVVGHLDLVAGLPGENFAGFVASLQGLFELEPDHIQVELLKVMKGTAMRGIARKEGYRYQESAPYQVLCTPWLDYRELRRIETVSRVVEQWYNSGRFKTALATLAADVPLAELFVAAAAFFEAEGIAATLALVPSFETFWAFGAARVPADERELLADALSYDYCLTGYPGGNLPSFFQANVPKGAQGAPPKIGTARPGERIRCYRRRFLREYRQTPWGDGGTDLTFVYRSAPGEGLTVTVSPSAP